MERVRDLLRRSIWNVGGIEQKFPAELSGGQRKRVGLARALIDRPEILLYDEPTTGLDPVATKNVDEMIRRTADDFGVTSVVISHDMASTFRIGDRISMLAEGKIVVTGTPQEVLASRHPALREFIETSGLVGTREGRAAHEAELGVDHRRRAGAARRRDQLHADSFDQRAQHGQRGDCPCWALFHDASGLFEKSRVMTAGISVGQIEKRELDPKTAKAKITIRIAPNIKLYENAVVTKKSASLLGEYYLEIDPGTEFEEVERPPRRGCAP